MLPDRSVTRLAGQGPRRLYVGGISTGNALVHGIRGRTTIVSSVAQGQAGIEPASPRQNNGGIRGRTTIVSSDCAFRGT